MARHSKVTGFTLFELLIVMVLIGLAVAFISPRLGGTLGAAGSRAAARQIAAVLRYGRLQAIEQRQSVAAWFAPNRNEVTTRPIEPFPDRNEKGQTPEQQSDRLPALGHYRFGTGVSIIGGGSEGQESGGNGFAIVFFADGSSSGGEVTVASSDRKRFKVVVDSITGTITVQDDRKS